MDIFDICPIIVVICLIVGMIIIAGIWIKSYFDNQEKREKDRKLQSELIDKRRMYLEKTSKQEEKTSKQENKTSWFYTQGSKEITEEEYNEKKTPEKFSQLIDEAFIIPECPDCFHNTYGIIKFSENFNLVELRCSSCEKRIRESTRSIQKSIEIKSLVGGSFHYYARIPITANSKKVANIMNRKPIPGNVKRYVWKRDGGKCVQCGNNQKLEYDHIIPLSKGGSNTERNIQLLCEKCNREKHDKI